MSTQAINVKLGNNSSDYLDIKDSIVNSKTNSLMRLNKLVRLKDGNNSIVIPQSLIGNIANRLRFYLTSEPMEDIYKGRPKLFCNDKYGNLDVYQIIMYLNSAFRPDQFIKDQVYFLNATGMNLYKTLIERYNPYNAVSNEYALKRFRNID